MKADMCIPIAQLDRIKKYELHGGGMMDMGVYPIQLACLVYNQMPETIQALGNLTDTGRLNMFYSCFRLNKNEVFIISSFNLY